MGGGRRRRLYALDAYMCRCIYMYLYISSPSPVGQSNVFGFNITPKWTREQNSVYAMWRWHNTAF